MTIKNNFNAIVGISYRFPKLSENSPAFWDLLANNENMVSTIDPTRFSKEAFSPFLRQSIWNSETKFKPFSAGVIPAVYDFDARFFGFSPRETISMDPQQRLMLEMTWEALEDAEIIPGKIRGSKTAVFVGAASTDMAMVNADDIHIGGPYSMTGNTLSIVSNRVSYIYDFHGPSMTIDTACSSSLVALNEACKALKNGSADMAVVGGVNVLLSPLPFIGFSKAHMLSPDGRCKVFDEEANGYVRSEGGAVILIKPLQNAIRDGNKIHAIIRETEVNSDGKTNGIALPNGLAQQTLLKTVYKRLGPDVNRLAYVEAHGTGTPVGDPIEAESIGTVLGRGRKKPLLIGSVKGNIGHLETASGMAGLIKAILVLKHGMVPAQVNLNKLSSKIDFKNLNIRIPLQNEPLPDVGGAPIVGVNSFGFGGTNAHVVIEKFQPTEEIKFKTTDPETYNKPEDVKAPPLVISAKSEKSLRALAGRYSEFIDQYPGSMIDIVSAVQNTRTEFPFKFLVRGTKEERKLQVNAFFKGESTIPYLSAFENSPLPAAKTAFVFSGNGSQWEKMGSDFYHSSDTFRRTVDEIDEIFKPLAKWSISECFAKPADQWDLSATEISQPLLFAYQVGVCRILQEEGVVADLVTGHSVGEVAAAWYSSALSLQDAVKVIHERSFLQGTTKGTGSMAAARMERKKLSRLLSRFPGIEIAGFNTKDDFTLTGQKEDLTSLLKLVIDQGGLFVHLPLDYPFHSTKMQPIKEQVFETLKDISPVEEKVSFVSAVTGKRLNGKELTGEYWWKNIREPVMFKSSIETILKAGVNRIAEIGPHAILSGYVRAIAKNKKKEVAIYHLQSKKTDINFFYSQLNKLIASGWPIKKLQAKVPHLDLPTYQWDKQSYIPEPTIESERLYKKIFIDDELGYEVISAKGNWDKEISLADYPWLADHKIEQSNLYPASGFLLAALSASRVTKPKVVSELINVSIQRPLVISKDTSLAMRTTLTDRGTLSISGREIMVTREFNPIVEGRVVSSSNIGYGKPFVLPPDAEQIDISGIYQQLENIGYRYGPSFRVLKKLWKKDGAFYGMLQAPEGCSKYNSEVALLDGSFHVLLASLANRFQEQTPFLPSWFDRVKRYRSGTPRWVKTEIRRVSPQSITADFQIYDDSYALIIELRGAKFKRMPGLAKNPPKWYQEKWYKLDTHSLFAPSSPMENALTQFTDKTLLPTEGEKASEYVRKLFDAYIASTIYEAVKYKDEWISAGNLFTDSFDIERPDYASFLLEILESFDLAEGNEKGEFKVLKGANIPDSRQIFAEIIKRDARAWPLLCKISFIGSRLPQIIEGSVKNDDLLSEFKRLDRFTFNASEANSAIEAQKNTLVDFISQAQQKAPVLLRIGLLVEESGEELTRFLDLRSPEVEISLIANSERVFSVLKTQYEERRGIKVYGFSEKAPERVPNGYFDAICKIGFYSPFDIERSKFCLIRKALKPCGGFICIENPYNLTMGFVEAAMVQKAPDTTELGTILREAGFLQIDKESFGREYNLYKASTPDTTESNQERIERLNVLLFDKKEKNVEKIVDCLAQQTKIKLLNNELKGNIKGRTVCFFDFGSGRNPYSCPVELLDFFKSIAEAKVAFEDLVIIVGHSDSVKANAIRGISRSARNEVGSLALSLVFMQDFSKEALDYLSGVVCGKEISADEIKVDRTGVYVSKVSELKLPSPLKPVRELSFDLPGRLENLYWKRVDSKTIGDDEVRIKVKATGLNFRDVLWSMGLLPDEALEDGFSGPCLGLEAAGVVIEKGSAVNQVEVGDSVLAFAGNCFASEIVTKAQSTCKMPTFMTYAVAASIPVAFFTAWYAITYLARAKAGERILIHGAAGGVGLAAIQISKLLGLDIYATAGSELKRNFLRSLGIKHVYDSRSLEFASKIKDSDGGNVNIVLNSLAGEGAEKSLECLAPFGRFLELGKRDFYADNPLYLRPFRRNLSYFGIDIDQLFMSDPDLAQTLFTEVVENFESGSLSPLPISVFPESEVQTAFHAMQSSDQIGKIVVEYPDAESQFEESKKSKNIFVREDATYVITGALGGLGKKLVLFMAAKGAKNFVLITRHDVKEEQDKSFLEKLEQIGVTANLVTVDISTPKGLGLVEQVLEGKNVKGILHAAGTLADAMLVNQTGSTFEKVWKPKVLGLNNLDKITRKLHLDLDWFIAFSSATVLFGNPGQANYVAANMAMESIMASRWHRNLQGSLIGWGPVGDVGMLATDDHAKQILERLTGAASLTSNQVCAAVEEVARFGCGNVHYLAVSWESLSKLPAIGSQRFSDFCIPKPSEDLANSNFLKSLEDKPDDEKKHLLANLIAREISLLMGVPVEEINLQKPMTEIGLDSLMAVELLNALEKRLDRKLSTSSFMGSTTIEDFADVVIRTLFKKGEENDLLAETLEKQHGSNVSKKLKSKLIKEVL